MLDVYAEARRGEPAPEVSGDSPRRGRLRRRRGVHDSSAAFLNYVILGAAAYLLGSVPVALIMSAVLKRTDLRRIGSGNLGVLNTMFNVGKLPGLLTIVGHGILAALTVFLAGWFPEGWFPWGWQYPADWWVPMRDDVGLMVAMAGLTAGNMWQLFAKFRGSRGSTTVGWALLVAAPLMLLVLFGVWLAAILALRRNVPAAPRASRGDPGSLRAHAGLVDVRDRRGRDRGAADAQGRL